MVTVNSNVIFLILKSNISLLFDIKPNKKKYFPLLFYIFAFYKTYFVRNKNFYPLRTKSRLLYLKIHFVPRSKHFSSRL